MNEISGFSESELKNKINIFRQQIDHKERDIKALYQEMNHLNRGGQELRAKRDELNSQVKDVKEKADEYRNKRDEVNNKIAELKKQKDELKGRNDGYTGKMGELKKTRDDLNNLAKGRFESLNNAYIDELAKFSTADIPLEHEQFLFKRIKELGERLTATREANTIHGEMSNIYNKMSEFHQELDTIYALIRDMALESQEYHEALLEVYASADATRHQANEYHQRLMEMRELTHPIKEKIDILKISVSDIRKELDEYLDRMNEIQLDKDEKQMQEKRTTAKEKFKKQGRLSLEDLKVLMENDEIEFS